MSTGTTAQSNQAYIQQSIVESAKVLSDLTSLSSTIESIAQVLVDRYKKGGKMVLFGNGGSAADSQHLATELLGGFTNHNRKSLPALALSTDTSALTSISNDYSFDQVFSRQVESMVNANDVVIAISTSGNSKNVILGAQEAKKRKAVVVGLTGADGGKLKAECDYCVCVPSKVTHYIQQAHITIGHILCAIIEKEVAENR